MSRYAVGTLLVIASALAFGTMSVIARQAFESGVTVTQLMTLRFGMSTVFLGLLVVARRARMPEKRKAIELLVMGAIIYFAQSFALYNALERIPAGLASLLLYTYPAIVAVAAVVFFREKLSLSKVGALLLAMVGVALTIGPVGGANTIGVLFGIASGISYAAYVVFGTHAMKGVAALPATFIVLLGSELTYLALAFGTSAGLPTGIEPYLWAALLAASTVVAITTFLAGLRRVGPVDASTYSAIEPAVTALLAFLLLGEVLHPLQMAGGCLALAAVAFLARVSSKGSKSRGLSG